MKYVIAFCLYMGSVTITGDNGDKFIVTKPGQKIHFKKDVLYSINDGHFYYRASKDRKIEVPDKSKKLKF